MHQVLLSRTYTRQMTLALFSRKVRSGLKWVKRHPIPVATSVALLLLLVGATITAAILVAEQYRRSDENKAHVVATQAMSLIMSDLRLTLEPTWSLAAYVEAQPQWTELTAVFPRLAPILARNVQPQGSVLKIDLLPHFRGPVATWPDPNATIDFEFLGAANPTREYNIQIIQDHLPVVIVGTGTGELGAGQIPRNTLLVSTPVYVQNVAANDTFGTPPPLYCTVCYNPATRTRFWGVVTTYFSLEHLANGACHCLSELVQRHRYHLSAAWYWDDVTYWSMVGQSNPRPNMDRVVRVEGELLPGASKWALEVEYNNSGQAPLIAILVVGVLVSIVMTGLFCLLLMGRWKYKTLVEMLAPKNVIDTLWKEAKDNSQRGKPMVAVGTPAGKLTSMLGMMLDGHMPGLQDIITMRTAMEQGWDLHRPFNLAATLKDADMEADVADALMRQLAVGGNRVGSTFPYPVVVRRLNTNTNILDSNQSGFSTPRRNSMDCFAALPEALALLMDVNGPSTLDETASCSSLTRSTLSTSGKKALPVPMCLEPPPLPSLPAPILEAVEAVLAKVDGWAFDAFELAEATLGHPLSTMAFFLFHRHGLIDRFKIHSVRLARFLRTIEDGYSNNPYHNATHAADVLQSVHVLLHSGGLVGGYADPLVLMGCYLAAVVHDYQHPGLTGDFLVNTHHTLALKYNDRAPLENHHASAGLSLLHQRPTACLTGVSRADMVALRKLVVDLVLATDMKQHFNIISQFSALFPVTVAGSSVRESKGGVYHHNSQDHHYNEAKGATSISRPTDMEPQGGSMTVGPGLGGVAHPGSRLRTSAEGGRPEPKSDAERLVALQLLLKCADLGHLSAELPVHKKWLNRLEEEFFLQGDEEKALGIPVSPLFDRTKQGASKSQVGFFEFVVNPLFQHMARAFPGTQPMLALVMANYSYYKEQQHNPAPPQQQHTAVAVDEPATKPTAAAPAANGASNGASHPAPATVVTAATEPVVSIVVESGGK